MGSRITKALYKQQRKQPIKKQRQQDIKVLIVCFLGSINTIYFFLFGYLFRPHIRTPDSLSLFFIMLTLFFFLQLKQINKAALITSSALFFAVILTKLLSINLPLLKAALILTTTTLSAVTCFQIGSSSFLQALFLWLAYSSFGLGVKLSLAVSKIKIQNNQNDEIGREQTMLVQIVFSLIGIMSIVLMSVGKKILKSKPSDSQKQTAFGKQILYASLNFILVAFCFGYRSSLQHSFTNELIVVAAAFITIIVFKRLQILGKLWIIICILALAINLLDFLTQQQAQIAYLTTFGRILTIDLAIMDCVQKWIGWSSNGVHRPILIVFIYFSSFYLSQFSNIGVKIISNFTSTYMQIIALSIYGALQLLYKFDKANSQNYEEVVV